MPRNVGKQVRFELERFAADITIATIEEYGEEDDVDYNPDAAVAVNTVLTRLVKRFGLSQDAVDEMVARRRATLEMRDEGQEEG